MYSTQTAPANDLATNYQRDGFILVPGVFSLDRCRELKAEGLELLRGKANPNSSVFVGVAAASQMFYELASDPLIVEVLRQIMPDGVMFMSDKFVFKSGEKRFPTPWHADQSYWKNTRPKLSVWIPLDDVSAANGTLKVIPGGHKRHWDHSISDGQASNGEFGSVIAELPETAPDELICEMPAGSLLFFSDLLPHASTANTSGADRYAIISTYHASAPDEEFDKNFPARHVVA